MMQLRANLDTLATISSALHKRITSDSVVVMLNGDLSSGKTTLVNDYLSRYADTHATSPTFVGVHQYSDSIFHYDMYLKEDQEQQTIELLQQLESKGIHFVEWGNQTLLELLRAYGYTIIKITIEKSNDERIYTIE